MIRRLGSLGGFSVDTSGYPITSVPVGARWGVSITGAAPLQEVVIHQTMPSGVASDYTMGSTDGAGNFTYSAVLDERLLGKWRSTWTVGNLAAGAYELTVVPAGAAAAPAALPAGVLTPAPGPAAAPAGAPGAGLVVFGLDLGRAYGPLPLWAWLAAGAGLVLFRGKR